MLQKIQEVFKGFAQVESHIFALIGVVFFIQLIESSFFILFNFYLKDLGYDDPDIAQLVSFRYMAVMLLAFPLGLFIKGRRLKPFLMLASVGVPTVSLFVLHALANSWEWMAYAGMIVAGIMGTCMQVVTLPFIVLNAKKERHSEAFSMYFQCFSATAFFAGLINYILNTISPTFFTEAVVLQIFACAGFISCFFVYKIKIKEKLSEPVPLRKVFQSYDWSKILLVSTPTLMIAIGAGLTIPFLNLFFLNVHGIDSRDFSLFGSLSFVLVTLMLFFIPIIRRRFGYKMVITLFQALAVLALFLMATTEYYADWEYAGGIAIIMFLIRQPLMNVAGPSVSELSLYYVGERNQEMIGALNASIWSGSWFLSSQIFRYFRSSGMAYVDIFLITVGMYIIAIMWYVILINAYYRKEKAQES